MKLLELEIRNLKSITKAKIYFRLAGSTDYQVSLLYGDNGAGKTTVLEAISLLGHISTMRRIQVTGRDVVTTESRFRQSKEAQQAMDPDPTTALRQQAYEKYQPAAFSDQCDLIRDGGLDDWWNSASENGDPRRRAIVRYCVKYNNDVFEFFISFLQNQDLSITEALSREQKGLGAKIHDGNMDNWFAVVYKFQVREHVDNLIMHMEQVSPHSYWSAAEEYKTDSRAANRNIARSLVAYWNTDLNDFGRKNDLRESVKKIRLDFVDQMIARLGLALPDNTGKLHFLGSTDLEQAQLAPLNDSLKRALVDHAVAMQGQPKRLAEEGLIRLTQIRAEPLSMRARRISELEDIEIDHLSAGENESIFIFLLMHGMPCMDSIILLDEPDLHLSDFAKSEFYTELYRLARIARCQLIISTHSSFAYASATDGHRTHHHLRRASEVDGNGTVKVVYRTDWDDRFGELLAFYYIRCALHAVSEAGPGWKYLSAPLKVSVKIGEAQGMGVWAAVTIFGAFVGLYSLVAMLLDITFLTHSDPVWHRVAIQTGAAVCLLLCIVFLLIRFAPRWTKPSERS